MWLNAEIVEIEAVKVKFLVLQHNLNSRKYLETYLQSVKQKE